MQSSLMQTRSFFVLESQHVLEVKMNLNVIANTRLHSSLRRWVALSVINRRL
jgi:hypothetical protein